MRTLKWLVLVALAMLASCGTGDGDFEDSDIWQQTFSPGNAMTMTLDSGASIYLPATTFDENTKVLFSDNLDADDIDEDFYPTTFQEDNDMLGGVVINTPVDTVFESTITVKLAMIDYSDDYKPAIETSTDYALYRFDFEENRWNRWGSTVATTDSAGEYATVTLPTTGFMGFLGSIAIFEGLTADNVGAVQTTYIEGYVKDISGNPLSTDVAIYQLVGDVKYPVDLSSVNDDARIPNLEDPQDSTQQISVACVVDSDPTTGYFQIALPWRLISTLVRLEFGRETAGHQVQDQWVIEYPLPYEESDQGDEVSALSVAYGRNTITPEPVFVSN